MTISTAADFFCEKCSSMFFKIFALFFVWASVMLLDTANILCPFNNKIHEVPFCSPISDSLHLAKTVGLIVLNSAISGWSVQQLIFTHRWFYFVRQLHAKRYQTKRGLLSFFNWGHFYKINLKMLQGKENSIGQVVVKYFWHSAENSHKESTSMAFQIIFLGKSVLSSKSSQIRFVSFTKNFIK